MPSPNMPASIDQASGQPCLGLQTPDTAWEQGRDVRFAAFLRARLAHAEATGCTDERRWAAGVRSVFVEWDERRQLAANADDVLFKVQVSALGWALRCVAHETWSCAPGWEPGFHPQATPPESVSNTRS